LAGRHHSRWWRAGDWRPLCFHIHGILRACGPSGDAVSRTLAGAAASSATAELDVTASSFATGALHDHSVAVVKGNEVVYREALHAYFAASGTAARAGATVPTVTTLLSGP
jgi:hypothetical protein